jgi:quinoprotein glucose dehydrogenase
MRILIFTVALASVAQAQTDWPLIGHDAGGTRYSPLKQINAKNVTKLQLAWSFDAEAPVVDPPGRGRRGAAPPDAAPPDAPMPLPAVERPRPRESASPRPLLWWLAM